MNTKKQVSYSEEIDLNIFFSAVRKGKYIVLFITMIFMIGSLFYAFLMPSIYKTEVLLSPVSESNGINFSGQISGLAALAGVDLAKKGGEKAALAIDILKSRDFMLYFINKYDLYVPIMASKGWDRNTNKLLIDNSIYDEKSSTWVRKVKEPFKPKPSALETLETFNDAVLISQNKLTGTIVISIEHYSPYLAKYWLENLVTEVNETMRLRDLDEANRSIKYLNEKLKETNITELKSMFYSLIEEQTKILMMANSRSDYVLRTIDSAFLPEKKSKPNRIVIVFINALLGLFLGVFIAYYKHKV